MTPRPTSSPPNVTALADAAADAQWSRQAQLADGAICHYTDHVRILPYLANYAAWGLARAYAATAGTEDIDAAWRWLGWYQAHQDANGFVTDYTVSNGVETSTGDMDSTDAYAGTFLLAARETWRASHDLGRLRLVAAGIRAAVHAIEATQQPDGLTWAKPTYHAKYLMDQAETYAGLWSAVELSSPLADTELGNRATADAGRVKTGVDATWTASQSLYSFARNGDGTAAPTSWDVFYPQALSQAWAVALGDAAVPDHPLVDPARAAMLMSRFTSRWPQWAVPQGHAMYDTGVRQTGYWAPVGWALAAVGRDTAAATGAATIRAAAILSGRAWPFTPADAGQLILLEPRI